MQTTEARSSTPQLPNWRREATTNSRSRSSEACRVSTPRLPNCRRSRLVASIHLLFVYFPRLWAASISCAPTRIRNYLQWTPTGRVSFIPKQIGIRYCADCCRFYNTSQIDVYAVTGGGRWADKAAGKGFRSEPISPACCVAFLATAE
jgi:hypothetical protein